MRNPHDLTFRDWLHPIVERVLDGGEPTAAEALRMLEAEGADAFELFAGANRIREAFQGADIHLCSIVNAKSGRCSEDCGFCSQSAHFKSPIPEYDLVSSEECVEHAEAARARGSQALGIVAAWKGLKKGAQLDAVLERVRAVAQVDGIHADASLGLIEDPEIPEMLKEAGLVTYNHNLETSRGHFETICTTHDYDDRVALAMELKALEVDVIPLNFLNPMEGTPMEDSALLPPMECLKTVAMFRFVHPSREVMVAGGREVALRDLQPLMFVAGASATMAGHYLTSSGRSTSDDWRMIQDLQMDYRPPGAPRPPGEEQTLGIQAEEEDRTVARGIRFPILESADLQGR